MEANFQPTAGRQAREAGQQGSSRCGEVERQPCRRPASDQFNKALGRGRYAITGRG
jgi:hypothetical protein